MSPRKAPTWYEAACEAIHEGYTAHRREHPEATPKESFIHARDNCYPFGPREHHPYKAWLAALKQYWAELVKQGLVP